MEIWLARFLALAAVAVGGLLTLRVVTFPELELEHSTVVGLSFLAIGMFLLFFSLRRAWLAHLDTAISYAFVAVFAVGAAYSTFVLRDGELAILCLLMMVYTIGATLAQGEQSAESLRVSVGRFLFVMGRYFAAFAGGFGVAFLIVAPAAPAGWFLTAVGGVFLGIAYLSNRFLLSGTEQ